MGIDDDFPMTRTQAKVLVVGLVAMMVFGLVLFGGFLPGIKPSAAAPTTVVVNGHPYYYETVSLSTPPLFSNATLPQSFVFHNVTFWLWVTNWYSVGGSQLHGNGSEPNGTVYSFTIAPGAVPVENSTVYFSPDQLFRVSWQANSLFGSSVELLVRA